MRLCDGSLAAEFNGQCGEILNANKTGAVYLCLNAASASALKLAKRLRFGARRHTAGKPKFGNSPFVGSKAAIFTCALKFRYF
jgi:hypothetical protein